MPGDILNLNGQPPDSPKRKATRAKKQPWDRLPGEPLASYARFVAYKSLGAGRSLLLAYQAIKGSQRQHPPGCWTKDSVRYKWVDRARAWDLAVMSSVGQGNVVKFLATLEAFTAKVLSAVLADDCRPSSWKEVADALTILGPFYSYEVIKAVAEPGPAAPAHPKPGPRRVVG